MTQIFADDRLIANAVEYTDWDTERIQLLVCEQCGVVHCEHGNWVTLRASGDYVLFVPAFDDLAGADDMEWMEYQPPQFIERHGCIALGQREYAALRAIAGTLPARDTVTSLRSTEAARLIQWQAPGDVLGDRRADPSVRPEVILASSEGAAEEWTDIVERALHELLESADPAPLVATEPGDVVIELYLDLAGFPSWKALTRRGKRVGFYHEPGLVTFVDDVTA